MSKATEAHLFDFAPKLVNEGGRLGSGGAWGGQQAGLHASSLHLTVQLCSHLHIPMPLEACTRKRLL